ncbi:hypothetical protein SISNIDRAFT_468454 [Sistotremastrum niveocremeum HHB9708]|uniref:Uncharacterized protein n=1 Tax=Sistotremastrum niveocremeum HHB9708 TaxID=1314777 RepID=A0A164RMF0_9AGAM|nr:hypothetical protein SISNIDRAFT_468454 [Sistotremastrum niveocremeum HHB9708]
MLCNSGGGLYGWLIRDPVNPDEIGSILPRPWYQAKNLLWRESRHGPTPNMHTNAHYGLKSVTVAHFILLDNSVPQVLASIFLDFVSHPGLFIMCIRVISPPAPFHNQEISSETCRREQGLYFLARFPNNVDYSNRIASRVKLELLPNHQKHQRSLRACSAF